MILSPDQSVGPRTLSWDVKVNVFSVFVLHADTIRRVTNKNFWEARS
jgi:hypothetical protein